MNPELVEVLNALCDTEGIRQLNVGSDRLPRAEQRLYMLGAMNRMGATTIPQMEFCAARAPFPVTPGGVVHSGALPPVGSDTQYYLKMSERMAHVISIVSVPRPVSADRDADELRGQGCDSPVRVASHGDEAYVRLPADFPRKDLRRNVCAKCWREPEPGERFRKCSGCKFVYYCSRKCQRGGLEETQAGLHDAQGA